MNALDRKLWRDVIHLRGQMFAVALVVACGVATYVSMASVLESLRATRGAYYDRYGFADVFASLKRAPESLSREIAALPGVGRVETRIVTDVTLDVPGLDEPATGRVVSIPESAPPLLNRLHLRSGRYIEPDRADQVIISEAFALANHLAPGDSIGAVINGRWQQLRVVGVALSPEFVYELGNAATFVPDNRRFGVLWMGREALAAAFDMRGAFNDICMTVERGTSVADLIDRLDLLLARYGSLGAYGRKDQLSDRFLSDELAQLRANALFVPLVFLGVAVFLLHIVLTRLVTTQRDQIAVLKAFGYGNAAIGVHYMKFALVAVLIGTALGTGVGAWFGSLLTELYARYYKFPILRYVAGPGVIAQGAAVSAMAAMLGALGAVRKGVALPPAEAMRPEAPARFKPGLIERLPVMRLLSPAGRVIVRSLERNPWKANVSILAMALAESMLITGYFSYDAIGYMTDLQFYHAQREDAMVVFNRPLPERAIYDVAHLPGVLYAEPFRAVPVKVHSGQRERRLAIQGTVGRGELHLIVDRDGRRIPLPDEGLLMTAKLAEVLGVGVGDTLDVETLDGKRKRGNLVISALADELLGMQLYMTLPELKRFTGEGELISGAFLSVDGARSAELYRRLKTVPTVVGTAVHAVTVENFNRSMEETQGTMRSILVVFAGVMVFGIVYNSARISLSERGRELASLRVLGFTNREVGLMLLGEQAILVLLAIPVGWLVGYGISALIVNALSGENYRVPLIISSKTFASASIMVAVSAFLSALLVRRRINSLDIIEVLKTRE